MQPVAASPQNRPSRPIRREVEGPKQSTKSGVTWGLAALSPGAVSNSRDGQSSMGSFLEALVNVAAGYLLALVTQQAVFPIFELHTNLTEHAAIAGIFTLISLVRSYLLRRLFEHTTGAGRRDAAYRAQPERRCETGVSNAGT